MGRQIRVLLTMPYSINERMWYKRNESNPKMAHFLVQKEAKAVYPCRSNKIQRQIFRKDEQMSKDIKNYEHNENNQDMSIQMETDDEEEGKNLNLQNN